MALIQSGSIKGRVTLMVLTFGVLMMVINHLFHQGRVTESRLARLRLEAVQTASPLSGILQHLLRRKQDRAAELEMSYAALSPRLELGMVVDRNGMVKFSTQLQWRGLSIEQTPLGQDWPDLKKALDATDTITVSSFDDEGLLLGTRFYEGYDAASKGTVVMRYDYRQELMQARQDARHEFITHLGVLVALCLLLWYALDELVIQRVIKMQDYFRGAATSGRVPGMLEGNDELSMISREFTETVKRLRDAENHVLEAAEEERRKVGRELHDDLCQRITATKLKAEVVHELILEGSDRSSELARQLAEELSESAVIARSMARGLSPVGLEDGGLLDALENVAIFVKRSFNVRCTVECDSVIGVLSGNAQELLFRIAQELAVNAGKHSHPANMTITVCKASGMVDLVVQHDGSPFMEAPEAARAGMGLQLMKQRLFTLSATLERTVQDGPPKISIATVHIPIKSANNPPATDSHP